MNHERPILRDIPNRFASERLLIRTPLPGDGGAVHEAIQESRAELAPWMPWVSEHGSAEDTEAWVREAHARFLTRRDLPFLVFRRDDGTFVGGSGLHRIDWLVPRFEIGYWVRTSQTGRGLATEAASRIADFAFQALQAERVEIWCDARNERSASVARRSGFALEARLVRSRRDSAGELDDELCFARFAVPASGSVDGQPAESAGSTS